ncbi:MULTISPECIES: hypothetical protein [unclassified Bradyrhizobium]|uniref:hypothetical protein n=1 Tax=Bradyrhizobium sp. USDA 4541 TaxID=2817704 RepID=UPI0020A5219B|nr:hypothetical protein [Bradyrhizobium sp. USDA 4541]MCP1852788.1 hypothetical protein [Bradyrhizobium sp. USDA 4541]
MRRRSFLAALFAAPVLGPALAKTASPTAVGPRAIDANAGTLAAGTIRSPDVRWSIDFATGTISIRDDLFIDGPVTAARLSEI